MSLLSIEDVRAVDVPSDEANLLAWLGGPALLRIAGRDRSRSRAVSALLHGNEPSGLRAVHALRGALRSIRADGMPPRPDDGGAARDRNRVAEKVARRSIARRQLGLLNPARAVEAVDVRGTLFRV